MMQKIGVKTSYLLVDASGCASAVVVRDAYSDAALRGKRVLLLLHALQGLGQGYAKVRNIHRQHDNKFVCRSLSGDFLFVQVCMGSGTLCDRDIRNFVKSEAAVRAWGLPTTATPTRFLPNGPHSGRLEYEHAGGPTNQFQCGSWVERREFCTPRISSLLRRHGLVHLLPCVEQYFSETVTAYQQYAHVLLLGGRLNIMPEDLPPQLPEDLFSMLSVLFLDGGGKSRLGLHTDTEQLCPCVCSCDSLYPPGFHDFRGGELFFANGVWAEPYSRRDLVILMGHTVMHTVLPLTPSHHSPFRGCQMLRGSLVHWSHAGKELCGEMRRLLVYQSKLLSKGVALSGQYYDDWCANLRYQIRIILQHDDVNVPVPAAAPSNFQCWPSVNPVLSDLLGEAGLHLRMALSLRGGGAIRPCSKRNREA